MRVYNYNIVSKGHTNMTVKQNKLALSPFDSKRFLLFDGISTVSFGKKTAEENAFLENNWTPSGPTHTMKLITVLPILQFRIGDFYSGPTQKQRCKKKNLLVAESVNVPL